MKTVCFVNMKGGVGKTTLALNVADCLAKIHSKKVAVIDVDPQFNITQCLFKPSDYVAHLKAGSDTVIDIFDDQTQSITSAVQGVERKKPKELCDVELVNKENLWVLPGNIDLYRLEMRTGEGREFAIQRFKEEALADQGFDYVIIDTPPTPSVWMTSALIASDNYVIPVKPDPLSLIGIDLLRNIIEARRKSYGLTLKCAGVVFTMVERTDSVIYRDARTNLESNDYWKKYLIPGNIPKRAILAKNQLDAPFMLETEDFDLRTSLRDIVEELIKRIEP